MNEREMAAAHQSGEDLIRFGVTATDQPVLILPDSGCKPTSKVRKPKDMFPARFAIAMKREMENSGYQEQVLNNQSLQGCKLRERRASVRGHSRKYTIMHLHRLQKEPFKSGVQTHNFRCCRCFRRIRSARCPHDTLSRYC